MDKIKFIEKSHQYINTETSEEYLSVSKLISKFYKKFDADRISYFVAKKRGISKEEVLKEWDDTRIYACTRGTAFHLALENAIKYGDVDPEYKKVIENFLLVSSKCVKDIEKVNSELLLYNDEFKIAGTSDLCWEHEDGTFTIGDFKTNKNFRYTTEYNDWFYKPLDHLPNCEFNKYTLQLSIYAFMFEVLTGKRCRGLLILWLDQNTGKWQPIHCNYMKHEVIMMLKTYQKMISSKSNEVKDV